MTSAWCRSRSAVDDEFTVEVGGVGEVEVLERLAGGQPGAPDAGFGAVGLAGGDFTAQDRGEV
jgi:hypothetical protein